jgi:hypothetical protein
LYLGCLRQAWRLPDHLYARPAAAHLPDHLQARSFLPRPDAPLDLPQGRLTGTRLILIIL